MKKENKSIANSSGSQFQNYKIIKTLGQGTFGKVKRATHKYTDQSVAIKILNKQKIIQQPDVDRVTREIHILKIVRHPSIVQLYQIIETNKHLYLIMEYMENGELFNYIVSKKRLKQNQACRLFYQLLDGIQYLHKIKVVHRDLKPQNLLLDYKMNLKIVDFGLSNTYKQQSQKLKTACGSPCYAAPQMLKGQPYHGLGVDIWSSGVILFAMLCGYLPFQDMNNQAQLYNKIIQGQYNISVSISEQAKDLISKILNVNPQQRYTIEQIKKHPWMINNGSHYKSAVGIEVGKNQIPVDIRILNTLTQLGLNAEKTQMYLEANRHNIQTTTYFLSLKKFLKQGGKSPCDMSSKQFDRSLIQPIGTRNRRDNSKNMILMENFFPVNTQNNERRKSKQKRKQKLNKSKQKQNRQPNNQKSRDIIRTQKSSVLPPKKIRKDSKVGRIDPVIQCSINYGRPSTTKSVQKNIRPSQFENRVNRRYKQRFNQSLVSKSRQKLYQSTNYHQQSFHQPHQRSRIDSCLPRGTNRNQTYQVTQIIQQTQQGKQKRTISKKSCGQSIKSDLSRVAKARWM